MCPPGHLQAATDSNLSTARATEGSPNATPFPACTVCAERLTGSVVTGRHAAQHCETSTIAEQPHPCTGHKGSACLQVFGCVAVGLCRVASSQICPHPQAPLMCTVNPNFQSGLSALWDHLFSFPMGSTSCLANHTRHSSCLANVNQSSPGKVPFERRPDETRGLQTSL